MFQILKENPPILRIVCIKSIVTAKLWTLQRLFRRTKVETYSQPFEEGQEDKEA